MMRDEEEVEEEDFAWLLIAWEIQPEKGCSFAPNSLVGNRFVQILCSFFGESDNMSSECLKLKGY